MALPRKGDLAVETWDAVVRLDFVTICTTSTTPCPDCGMPAHSLDKFTRRSPAQAAPKGSQLCGRRRVLAVHRSLHLTEARLLTITENLARAVNRWAHGRGAQADQRVLLAAAQHDEAEIVPKSDEGVEPRSSRRDPSWLDMWRGEAFVAGLLEGAGESGVGRADY